MTRPKLIVHGGAWNIPEVYERAHLAGVNKALGSVYPLLEEGMTALDSVEQAVNILESDPTYDAGRGAFLNAVGEIELDAIIVDGSEINFGAVAGVKNIMHPVSLARKVMDNTEHCFLVGEGAYQYAITCGYEIYDPKDLLTDRELAYYNQIRLDPHFKTHFPFDLPSDTVGAVAMDIHGNIAAATSTGGTPRKLQGRVGDSPILGAGAYADNGKGGVSTTGWGESIMRSMLAKYVIEQLTFYAPMESVRHSLIYLQHKFKGLGGVIGVTSEGEYFFGYNTPKMAFGYVEKGKTRVSIKK